MQILHLAPKILIDLLSGNVDLTWLKNAQIAGRLKDIDIMPDDVLTVGTKLIFFDREDEPLVDYEDAPVVEYDDEPVVNREDETVVDREDEPVVDCEDDDSEDEGNNAYYMKIRHNNITILLAERAVRSLAPMYAQQQKDFLEDQKQIKAMKAALGILNWSLFCFFRLCFQIYNTYF